MKALRKVLELSLSAILFYTGFLFLHRKLPINGKKLPILLYHEIGDKRSGLYDGIYVRPEYFERQLAYLVKHYHIVSMSNLAKAFKNQKSLPDNSVLISFDGGYKGNYKYAYPLLKKYNAKAVLYLITGAIDANLAWERVLYYAFSMTNKTRFSLSEEYDKKVYYLNDSYERRKTYEETKRILNSCPMEKRERTFNEILNKLQVYPSDIYLRLFPDWQEIRELSKSGLVEIESHTVNHQRLTDIYETEAKREIEESKSRIEQQLRRPVTHFCYPDGLFSERIKHMVQTAGYETGLAVSSRNGTKGLNTLHDDPYELKRIYISNQPFICVFALQVSGILGAIVNVAKRLRRRRK